MNRVFCVLGAFGQDESIKIGEGSCDDPGEEPALVWSDDESDLGDPAQQNSQNKGAQASAMGAKAGAARYHYHAASKPLHPAGLGIPAEKLAALAVRLGLGRPKRVSYTGIVSQLQTLCFLSAGWRILVLLTL